MTHKLDPYGTAEESASAITVDTRTDAQKQIDRMLDARHINEQGITPAQALAISRDLAAELLEHLDAIVQTQDALIHAHTVLLKKVGKP